MNTTVSHGTSTVYQGILVILCLCKDSGKTWHNGLANKCENCQLWKCTMLALMSLLSFLL